MKRYLSVVGIILVGLVGFAMISKPKEHALKKHVEESFAAYAKANAGDALAPVKEMRSVDYILAASHRIELTDGRTFACSGAFNVVICADGDGK